MPVKREASPEVYVAGLRTYKSDSLDRTPREDEAETYITGLWLFVEKLVGLDTSVNNKIKSIDIFYNGRDSECECGAVIPVEGAAADTTEKLREPCRCRGAQGIILFETTKAATIFRSVIKTHKGLHQDGQLGLEADRSISLCEICCFKNRKIKCTTVKPEATDNDDDGDETEEENTDDIGPFETTPIIITEEQLNAAALILMGALGPSLTMQCTTLVTRIKGATMSGAYTSIVAGVREIFSNPTNETVLPKKFSEEVYRNAISNAVSKIIINMNSNVCVQKATEWSAKFAVCENGNVEMPEAEEVEVIAGDNNNGGNDLNNSGLLGSEADARIPEVVSEQELNKQYSEAEDVLDMCKRLEIGNTTGLNAANTILDRLKTSKAKALAIFIKLEKDERTRLKANHCTQLDIMTDAIKRVQYQMEFYKFTKEGAAPFAEGEGIKKASEKSHDLPSKSEINGDIKKFEVSVSQLDLAIQDVKDIIYDDEIEENKNEFNTIHTRIKPDIERIMGILAKLAEKFQRWNNRAKEISMEKDMKKKLNEKIKDEIRYFAEVGELNSRIAKIDKKFNHGIKSYEGSGLGGLLNQQKVEMFYGEEHVPGKAWQSLFDWLKKIEMQVCRNINDKASQLFEVMSYLSPNIKKIAMAYRPAFKTYNELKVWLIENHVDEARIVRELQNNIASLVPTKLKDLEGYIVHTRGILASMEEHCESYQRLRAMLHSEKNVASLIRFILGQISQVTGRDEFVWYINISWRPFVREMKAQGTPTTPDQELKKMDEFFDEILEMAKSIEEFDQKISTNQLSGPEVGNPGRGHGDFRGNYRRKGGRRGGARNSFSTYGRGRGNCFSKDNRDNTRDSGEYCLVAIGGRDRLSVGNAKVLTTDADEGYNLQSSKRKDAKSIYVQVTEDDLSKAKAWEKMRNKQLLACWLCASQTPHELWNCQDHESTTSWERFKKARDKNFGPGTQCFSCLSGVCFITRALETAKNFKDSEGNHLKPCDNYKKLNLETEIACTGCVDDAAKSSDGLIKKQRPMHAVICPKKEHCDGPVKGSNIKKIRQKFGNKNAPKMQIQYIMHALENQNNSEFGIQTNNVDNSSDSQYKNDTKTKKHPGPHKILPEISEKEYKGNETSRLLDTTNGESTHLDMQKNEILKTLIKASKGLPLYFMQEFNLDGIKVLCFFDSGAMFNLIKTAIARQLKLKMTSRKPMYVIGAGEHVHSTGDGKYELVLGQGNHGERYLLEVAGSQELTGYMLEADFKPSHEEVRDLAKQYADKGHEVMSEDEKLPLRVGGAKAGMIIGLTTPALQPKIIMCLPSGLLVARSRLKDTNGSQIVFGGMFNNYKRFFQTNYIGHPNLTPGLYKMTPAQVDEYTARHLICWQEYCTYRDSLRMDVVHFSQGREHNTKWKNVIDEESDAMVEDAPVIIAGSEEKRGDQLRRQEVTRRLINAGKEIVFQKKVHEEVEPLKQFQVGPVRENLAREEVEARRFQNSVCQPRNTVINETLEHNILMKHEEVDARKAKIDELVNERFHIEKEKPPIQEGVYFQANADKISYYEELGDEPELEDLLLRNTTVQNIANKNCTIDTKGLVVCQKSTNSYLRVNDNVTVGPEECTIGASGLVAFQKAANKSLGPDEDVTVVSEECKVDHGCLCSTGDLDFIFDNIADDLTNADKVHWNKMKKAIRKWEDDETIGTGVDYRCSKCLNCKDCLNSGRTRARSQREEDEQRVIESSVRIDWSTKKCYVFLPWIKSPQELALKWGAKSNFKQANHFLRKMLAKSPEDRASLTRFWEELKKRDVVTRLRDLSEDLQKQILGSAVHHFYPWNCVFKESITTPCRMVVDSRTSGLNDHLAKGLNTLNNLQQLLIKFRSYKHIGSFDISKMYNMLYIEESHLQYQLILWVDEMDPKREVEVYVMLRAIYGTVSSGNQAEVAIRRGATKLQEEYPQGAHTIINETYVDDGVPCRDDRSELEQALKEVEIILDKIGFSLKCVTTSGQVAPLSEKASSDGTTIGLAGYCYEPKKDLISLAFKECNFNRIIRGTKAPNKHPVKFGSDIDDEIFPEKLTRAQCVGKLAECFDLLGLFMPLTMQGKIMARKIAYLDWAEYIPQELMKDWLEICKKIQDTRHVKIDRCVIPPEAIDATTTDLMEVHDGSKEGAATVVYARCLLKDGTYSTRMAFSRSCLCPVGQIVPRNELASSHLGATAAYITRLALAGKVKNTYTFGDSTVALLWSENPELKLKSWMFARVQDIKRLNGQAKAFWIKGTMNIADIATKGVVTMEELGNNSHWHSGLPWMHLSIEQLLEQDLIRDFEGVMKHLSAKDRDILREEQNPSLPDLAASSRKNKNPEFDIATIETVENNQDFSQIVQCYKMSHDEPNSQSDICQPVGVLEDLRIVDTRDEVPPEFFAGMWFGVTPDMMIRNFVEIPEDLSNDLSLLVGGMKLKRANHFEGEISRRQVTRYGWEVTFRASSVLAYYRMKTQHKAHQTPAPGHHLYGNISPHQQKVRDKLAETCRICGNVPKLSKKDVNMAYLDSLCSGQMPDVNREDKIIRKSGNQDWKPSWTNTAKMKEYQTERACFVTTRAKSKGWVSPGKFLRKNSGKKDYKSRKRPVKPSQKPKKVQEPAKTEEEIIEEIRIGDQVKIVTWRYFNREMSEKVTENLTAKEKEKFEYDENDQVWKHFGRLLERREIEYRDVEVEEFLDASTISFVQPVGMATDPLVFQLLLHIHWKIHPHKGVPSTNRVVANILYVIRGGYVIRALRDECQRCRIILKKQIKECMGSIPPEKLIVSPAFSFCQIDIGGPFKAYSPHGKRSVLEVNALVIVCITTGAVSILVLETMEAPCVVKALVRHACRYGYPIIGYTDKGTGLKKGLGVQLELMNFERVISKETGMKLVLKPTQSHESRGKVERVVQVLKKYIQERKGETLTQSIMDWETTFCYVSNFVNNLPMARMTNTRSLSYDIAEIVTPNRLLLGKNNQRSPNCVIEEKGVTYKDRLSKNNKIMQAFFTLLNRMTPDLVDRPKWHKSSDMLPKVGDYCLFKHKESNMGSEHEHWKIGKVIEIRDSESNAESKIYILEYRTATKQKKKKAESWTVTVQITDRAARELVILFTPEELNSEVGSEEHLARLKEKIAKGTKKKSWRTGKNVRKNRIPKH